MNFASLPKDLQKKWGKQHLGLRIKQNEKYFQKKIKYMFVCFKLLKYIEKIDQIVCVYFFF